MYWFPCYCEVGKQLELRWGLLPESDSACRKCVFAGFYYPQGFEMH